jgi:NAD(P)-dependent dehydrogenase (short-subunit alcohol dehydrogenase family)
MYEFNDKVAIVTGGASGIGRAVAFMYAQNGAKIIVSDINDRLGEETVAMIRKGKGEAWYFRTDVTQARENEKLVDFTLNKFGRLDFACNNAGIGGEQNLTGAYSIEGWDKVIATNLSGIFYGMRYEIPAMLKTGGGAIVNMASILGQVAFSGAPAYVAAKHGVVGLTRSAAVEYAKEGIRVNAVGPAFIQTPMISAVDSDPAMHSALVGMHPIGRLGQPEEVAELVMWLSSNKASFVTGSYYAVDGGYLAQ